MLSESVNGFKYDSEHRHDASLAAHGTCRSLVADGDELLQRLASLSKNIDFKVEELLQEP